jgi:LAGLIDADG DNA endonuclease family
MNIIDSQYKKSDLEQIEAFNRNVLSRNLRGAALINYKRSLSLTPEQKSVLIGTLLGDAIIRNSKANYNMKFEQNEQRTEYIIHLAEVFEPFTGTGPKKHVIRNSFHKDYGVSCWFRTYAHIVFKYYANLFYHIDNKKRKKRVPKNIHKYLDARALTYWFMDDGSYYYNPLDLMLNTQGFKLSDQKILIQALKRNFDLDAAIIKDKDYLRLLFDRSSSAKMAQFIEPYMHLDLGYKFETILGAKKPYLLT